MGILALGPSPCFPDLPQPACPRPFRSFDEAKSRQDAPTEVRSAKAAGSTLVIGRIPDRPVLLVGAPV